MRHIARPVTVLSLSLVFLAASGASVTAQSLTGVRAELMSDINVVEAKFVGLASALDAAQYEWRPADGIRSAGKVFLHIAGNNYHLPTTVGVSPPTNVPIDDSYQSVVAFEQNGARDDIIRHVQESFVHLKAALERTPDSELDREVRFFGRTTTVRGAWFQTMTHLHEHLGQVIAYARSNGVTPPWSN